MKMALNRVAGKTNIILDSKVDGANMGPTWVLSAPAGPHVGPMNLAIKECLSVVLMPNFVPCSVVAGRWFIGTLSVNWNGSSYLLSYVKRRS